MLLLMQIGSLEKECDRYDNAMRVDNHGIQWRGVFYYTLTQNQWRKRNMMKKGKKWRRKENEKKNLAGWI